MNADARRGVTRGYVLGLVGSLAFLAISLLVGSWGVLAYLTGTAPIRNSELPLTVAPPILLVVLAVLAWGLWQQALVLLRGRRGPLWSLIIAHSFGGYLVWCLLGMLVGLNVSETWLSPYAWMIVPTWALSSVLFWAVLARRVYTDRPAPRWPWERREDREGRE